MRINIKDEIILAPVLIFLVLALALILHYSHVEINSYYTQQVNAAEQMKASMEAVKSYKKELGIPLSDEDYHQTGMIGEPFNLITTTLGDVEAKRTTANPDMAALIIKMMHEVGLQKGDRVGLGFSGSFPALNIAVLCAADEMGLEVVPITSVGASTYGANHYALTFPEMMHRLYKDGLISTDSAMVSLGGDYDVGVNIDADQVDAIEKRLVKEGLNLSKEPNLVRNIQLRMDTYGEIKCFIAVGGNITSGGISEEAITLDQGILWWKDYHGRIDGKSGIIQHYLSKQINVINLLNIEKITMAYGMPFDPLEQPKIGEGGIYHQITYPRFLVGIAFVIGIGVLFFLYRKRGA